MPELPEVETICKGLEKDLIGKTVKTVKANRKNLRVPFPRDLKSIEEQKITSITRRAKYILIHFKNSQTLIIHLGMSGRVTVTKKYEAQKHDHLLITLSSGKVIVLNDARRFGLVALCATEELPQHKLFAHLGPEPLDKEFNPRYLDEKLKAKKIAIKLAIMDQAVVVGVGNIYVSEALFSANIDPRRPANKVKPEELKKLVSAIKQTLKKAIKAGGSSLKDYVQADGTMGYFQNMCKVYGRVGEKCPSCNCDIKKTGGIQRIVQGGRASFYCAKKQK